MTSFDRTRLAALLDRERAAFAERHPKSRATSIAARPLLVGGVPMQWMVEWPGDFPIFLERGEGARLWDIDGHEYVDMCLGDTGAMFGHSPAPVAKAVADQASRGLTAMLPHPDIVWVAGDLKRRFGLPVWQFAMSATDANRFALRIAREFTGRRRIVVFHGCYHGTVDETVVSRRDGKTVSRNGNLGPAFDPAETTMAVQFNDLAELDAVLAKGDVACVLAEPALTNHTGIVLPDPGFHDALRALTRRHGALLLIDETHTFSSGPGGYTAAHGLQPDMLVLGKPIGGGVPSAAFGMSEELGRRMEARMGSRGTAIAGIGGTLIANALAVRAMRATLEQVATDANYAWMIALATQLEKDIQALIGRHGLPWYVTRLGCRVEYRFQPVRPRNGDEAAGGADAALDRLLHLRFLNRGLLMTPMHNMLLVCPATSEADVALHGRCLEELLSDLR